MKMDYRHWLMIAVALFVGYWLHGYVLRRKAKNYKKINGNGNGYLNSSQPSMTPEAVTTDVLEKDTEVERVETM